MQGKTMKALVYHGPGQYSLDDVPVPQIIEPTDVIGKVTLAAVCTSDIHIVHGDVQAVPYDKIMGHEFCVEIVEVGSEVKKWKVGDRCVSRAGANCGECPMCQIGIRGLCSSGGIYGSIGPLNGCHAEYIRIPWADSEGFLYKIPQSLSEEDVILTPDMLATAYFGLQNAELIPGQTLAVIGVGPVGMSVCLVAKKIFGAGKVIAIDIAQYRLDLLLKEGLADVVINSANDEVVAKVLTETGLGVDATIETPGLESTMALSSDITRPSGIISTIAVFSEPLVKLPLLTMIIKDQKLKMGIHRSPGVEEMLEMIKEGQLDAKFMLTHKSPLNDIMKGYEIFGQQLDGCVKWLITPYER